MAETQYRLVPPPTPDDDAREARMGFLEHLDELRRRLIRACIAIAAGMVVAFAFYDRIADFVLAPTLRTLPPNTSLIFTRPGEAFSFDLNVALIGGVVLAAPYVMFEVWQFIAPGLYAKEKKLVVPFVLLTAAGTIGGLLFTHYVMFPATIGFFAKFTGRRLVFMPRLEDTFDLYLNMVLGMVVVFQIPTLVLFLARLRLVTARLLWRNIKYAVLVIFIVAAVLTPSADPWNQTVFAAPMIGLYILSIGIAWLASPKSDREPDTGSPNLRLVIAASVAKSGFGARRPRRRVR